MCSCGDLTIPITTDEPVVPRLRRVLQGSLEGKSLTTYDNRLRAKYLVLTLFPSLEG